MAFTHRLDSLSKLNNTSASARSISAARKCVSFPEGIPDVLVSLLSSSFLFLPYFLSRHFPILRLTCSRYIQIYTEGNQIGIKGQTKTDLRSFVTRVLFRYDTTRCKDRRLIACVFYSVEIENSKGWSGNFAKRSARCPSSFQLRRRESKL